MDTTAFAALIKRKRGEARLTQETLALDVFGDSTRKADISRLENARVPNPQEATVQKICKALNISAAEMEPIRQSRLSAAQLDQIPTLSREELENLATRFQIEGVFDRPDPDLRQLLTKKAEEYRALRAQGNAIPQGMHRLFELKRKAQEALDELDLDRVDQLLEDVHTIELEEATKTAELRADNALLRGDAEKAHLLLRITAASSEVIDPLEPVRKVIRNYNQKLREHSRRYGGSGTVRSIEMVRFILTDRLRTDDEQLWGAGQNTLANALQEQGRRTEGPSGTGLLAQAVTAYRKALEVSLNAGDLVNCATTYQNLGAALAEQGIRTNSPNDAELLSQAVAAYHKALEVRTRSDHPEAWARTKYNLGNALQAQGIRTEGPSGADLLAESVKAYRDCLEVHIRTQYPEDWAKAQDNLGTALKDQGIRAEGPTGANLLTQAVLAYQKALEVRSRPEHPVDWAMTQHNLGNVFGLQGSRSEKAVAKDLFAQAVAAHHNALEVRTHADHPVQWAETQENIAINQKEIANHDICTDPKSALTDALAAVDAALTVYDPEHMSYRHNAAATLRDRILAQLKTLK
ncbi:MAG: helix-turn-helix transcriptional regulator [Pseudomonadota bacterium]